jgi:hypothetical protein
MAALFIGVLATLVINDIMKIATTTLKRGLAAMVQVSRSRREA